MPLYEYKVIPAPRRGEKIRGARTTADRFAQALTHVMNDLAREGWEYLRADTLPCEERTGLTGRTTAFQNMLVFRRALAEVAEPAASARQPDPEIVPRAPVAAVSADGVAPRIAISAPEPGAVPGIGPARDKGLAAE